MSDRWFGALCFFNVGIFIYKKNEKKMCEEDRESEIQS